MSKKRILIVGGVAGGASCAARIRRLNEGCEIVIYEMGSYVSFANCGLPYFIGDVIVEEEKLLVATPALFENRFNIRVCTDTQVFIPVKNTRLRVVQAMFSLPIVFWGGEGEL